MCLFANPHIENKKAWKFTNNSYNPLCSEYPDTIADGLRMSVGVHTWPVIKENVTDIITVTEKEIEDAMRLIWERMKVKFKSFYYSYSQIPA